MKKTNINIFSAKYIIALLAIIVLVGAVGFIEYSKQQKKNAFIAKAYEYSKTKDPSQKTALAGELNALWADKGFSKESKAYIPSGSMIAYLNMVADFCEEWTISQYYSAGSQWVAIEDPYYYCWNHSLSLMMNNTAD